MLQARFRFLSITLPVLLAAACGPLPESVESDESALEQGCTRARVAVELRLRQAPNITAAIVATMATGSTVKVLGLSGDWANVKYGNLSGWALSRSGTVHYLTCLVTPVCAPGQAQHAYVRAGSADIKSSASFFSGVRFTVPI